MSMTDPMIPLSSPKKLSKNQLEEIVEEIQRLVFTNCDGQVILSALSKPPKIDISLIINILDDSGLAKVEIEGEEIGLEDANVLRSTLLDGSVS